MGGCLTVSRLRSVKCYVCSEEISASDCCKGLIQDERLVYSHIKCEAKINKMRSRRSYTTKAPTKGITA